MSRGRAYGAGMVVRFGGNLFTIVAVDFGHQPERLDLEELEKSADPLKVMGVPADRVMFVREFELRESTEEREDREDRFDFESESRLRMMEAGADEYR